jgi:uncharacterized protein (TIGR00251 family)
MLQRKHSLPYPPPKEGIKKRGVTKMKIRIKAKPNSKIEGIKKIGEDYFEVRVSVPPEKGKANERIIELLSKYFDVPKTRISILRGGAGKDKLIEIQS